MGLSKLLMLKDKTLFPKLHLVAILWKYSDIKLFNYFTCRFLSEISCRRRMELDSGFTGHHM